MSKLWMSKLWMSKLWTQSSVLILIFFLGLALGRSGTYPGAARADASFEGGDASGFYWEETKDTLSLLNLSVGETYLVLAEFDTDEAWLNVGGDAPIVHAEESISIKSAGVSQLTAYRLAGVATKDGPELLRPCNAPPIDCPAPGRPPIPPRQKLVIIHDGQGDLYYP